MHQSVATIKSPEFINLQPMDLNPLMSSCEIKVLYIGENRNRSVISKDVASEMAKTLRGAPIVGYYKEKDEDFADHGEQVVFDDEGVHFNCLTTPYGFVAPDAKVWFQTFAEQDAFGNSIEREYLMTTGYLWTGQFPECQSVLEGDGKPHSMELDEKTLRGNWSENYKNGMDFFIINDAIFSKLCILGENVEPCFEGSTVTAPKLSTSFSMDDDFKNTLFTMMQELKSALEGGHMEEKNFSVEENIQGENVELVAPENVISTEEVESEFVASKEDEKKDSDKKKEEEKDFACKQVDEEDKKKYAADDKKKEDEDSKSEDKDDKKETASDDKEEDEEDKKDKKPFPPTKSELAVEENAELAQLKEDYSALQNQYSALEEQLEELKAFKNEIDNKAKDSLIAEFYMLSDEDKADIVANKEKYSLSDIKKELSAICFDKKVNFVENKVEETNKESVTFNLDGAETGSNLPAWMREVMDIQSRL